MKEEELLRSVAEKIASMQTQINDLTISNMAARDILGRLMSHVALADKDPDLILRGFSEAGDDASDKLVEANEDFGTIAEKMRREKDSLVSYARSLMRDDGRMR